MTVSKGSDAIEKVCRSERQRAGERGGPKERWGRAERALELSHKKKKKKKQNSVPNDACFDFVWHDTGQERQRERQRERERERERAQYVFKNTLHQGGTVL